MHTYTHPCPTLTRDTLLRQRARPQLQSSLLAARPLPLRAPPAAGGTRPLLHVFQEALCSEQAPMFNE